MQDLPDKQTLLGALAQFLSEQVQPAITDRGLAFRVRIAAHLADTLRREVAHEEAHDAAELARLRDLLGAEGLPSDRTDAIRTLNARLAQALREGTVDADAARASLLATLRDKLAVVQPRFDTRLDLEEAP